MLTISGAEAEKLGKNAAGSITVIKAVRADTEAMLNKCISRGETDYKTEYGRCPYSVLEVLRTSAALCAEFRLKHRFGFGSIPDIARHILFSSRLT